MNFILTLEGHAVDPANPIRPLEVAEHEAFRVRGGGRQVGDEDGRPSSEGGSKLRLWMASEPAVSVVPASEAKSSALMSHDACGRYAAGSAF
jgi:hypothetical protein